MALVELLDEVYAAKLRIENPSNICEHVVRYIQTEYFRRGRSVPSHFMFALLLQAIQVFKDLPNVAEVNRKTSGEDCVLSGRITVVGDLHGQYRDLEYLLSAEGPIGLPSEDNQVIVNGDMVDRGDMSVEILVLLMLFAIMIPGSVLMLRGNHEAERHLHEHFGFYHELNRKYPGEDVLLDLFEQLFGALPLAAVVDHAAFVVHGGLGRFTQHMSIEQLNRPDRSKPMINHTPIYELLWNDPSETNPTISPNNRGEAFGCTITETFLAKNKLRLLIRSHQQCDAGVKKQHNNLCWTVFSAANYCGTSHNLGAVLLFDEWYITDPKVVTYSGRHYPEDGPLYSFGHKYKGVHEGVIPIADDYDEIIDYGLQAALEVSLFASFVATVGGFAGDSTGGGNVDNGGNRGAGVINDGPRNDDSGGVDIAGDDDTLRQEEGWEMVVG